MSFWEGSEWQRQQETAKAERERIRLMTPEERTRRMAQPKPPPPVPRRVTALSIQDLDRAEALEARGTLATEEQAELDALKARAKAIAAPPEVADDKSTLFTDESRRPQLDGTDWNDFNNAACRGEVAAIGLKYGLPLIKLAVESLLKG